MNCGICAGQLVLIRGRHPRDAEREVCPVCLADRLDQIREISDKNYGRSCTVRPLETQQPVINPGEAETQS